MGLDKILTMDIGSGEGHKPLTFQKALSALLLLPCFFLYIAGYVANTTDSTYVVRVWFWTFLLSGLAFAIWHIWSVSPKRNIHPDILALLFKPKFIFEAGDAQLAFLLFQNSDQIKIISFIQNLHDSIASVQLDWAIQFSKDSSAISLPPIKHNIAGASVVMAEYRYPITPRDIKGQYAKITTQISTKATKKMRIRYNKRQVFDTKMKPWMSVMMLAGPIAIWGGSRFFTLKLEPVTGDSDSNKKPAESFFHTLWAPTSPNSKDEILNIIKRNAEVSFS